MKTLTYIVVGLFALACLAIASYAEEPKLEVVPQTFIEHLKQFKSDGHVVNAYPWRMYCVNDSAEFIVRLGNNGYDSVWSHESEEAGVKLFIVRNEDTKQMAQGVHAYEDDTACFSFYGKYE